MKKAFLYIGVIFFAQKLDAARMPVDAKKIGMQIFKNETSMKLENLVFWNPSEPFPSLGIGHFIWHPHGKKGQFEHQFPLLCDYLQKQGVQLPKWLEECKATGAPWASREELLNDFRRVAELRTLLHTTIDLQTKFMIGRLDQKIPLIIKAAPAEKKALIGRYIRFLKSSTQGRYALVDYCNFKGDGLVSRENIRGKSWGLLQVLLDLPDNLTQEKITTAFTVSAARILLRRVKNSAPHYSIAKFLPGWIARVGTYSDPTLFKS